MRFPLATLIVLSSAMYGQPEAFTPGDPLVVVQNGKYGYIDHDGRVLIPPQFIWGTWFAKGLATVYVCGREVSIDRNGKIQRKRIAIEGELVPKSNGSKVGFIDSTGEYRIAPVFDEVMPFQDGLAAARKGERWGFVDNRGEFVIPPKFREAFYFTNGIGQVKDDKGFLLIDRSGSKIATGFSYANTSQGRIPLSLDNGKAGFLDMNGSVAVPFLYDEIRAFSEGLAAVKQDGKWGFIDRDGRVVIPFQFEDASPFAKSLAPVRRGKRTGFIDHRGRFAFELPFRYSPGFLADDVAILWTDDNRMGYVTMAGKVIWGPIEGSPDHRPLLGWTEEDKVRSCEGVSEAVRNLIATFPTE